MDNIREQQLGGVHAQHLNTVLFPLMRLVVQRKKKQALCKRLPMLESRASALDACMGHPILHAFGRSVCESMLANSYRRVVLPNEAVLHFNESPRTAGILVCVSGSLKSRRQSLLRGGEVKSASPDHSRPAGDDYTSVVTASEWDVRGFRTADVRDGVPVIIESELSAPNVVGCVRVLQEVASTENVVAITPCDTWVIPLHVFHSHLVEVSASKRGLLRESRMLSCQPLFPLGPAHLRQSWVLSHVPSTVRDALASRMVPWVLLPGECLVNRGDVFNGIFILRRGTVRLKELGEEVHGALVVGERGAVFGEPYGSTIEAVTCCDVWSISSSDLAHQAVFPPAARDAVTSVGSTHYEQWLRERLHDESKQRDLNQLLVDALRRIPYLQGAPDAVLDELISEAEPRVFTPLRAVASASEQCNQLFIVAKGTCSYQVHGDDTQLVGRGASIGWECPVKHRWLRPVCTSTMVEAWVLSRAVVIRVLETYEMLAAAKAVCLTHLEKIATDTALQIIASPTRMSPKWRRNVGLGLQTKTPSPFHLHALEGNINYGRIEEYQAVQASSPYPTIRFAYPAAYPRTTQLAGPDLKSISKSEVHKPLLSSRSVSVLEEELPPEGTKLVHITPHIFLCVSNAECLGERSSWLACLLGRRFRSFGYLGLSSPLPGTMISISSGAPLNPSSTGMVVKRDPSANEVLVSAPNAVAQQHRHTRYTYAPHLPPTPKDETVGRAPLPRCFVQDDGLIDRILATGTADLRMDERRGLTSKDTGSRDMGDDDWRVEVEGPRVRLPIPRNHVRVRRPGRVKSIASASVGGSAEKEAPSDIPSPFVREYDSSLRRAKRRQVSSPLHRSPQRERSPRAPTQTQPSPDPHTPTRPLWVPKSVPRPSTSPRISCSGRKSRLILPTL